MARRSGPSDLRDTTPDVRVGIVSWNTAAHLDRCLTALPTALGDLDAEVVVVDNDSSDDSAAVARRHGVHTVVNDANLGYAVAMNQALDSEASVLVALNPDTVPAPGTLETLVDRLHVERGAGVVVPRLVGEDGRHQHSAYRFPTVGVLLIASVATHGVRTGPRGRRLLLEGSGPHADGPVDWAIGAVHVIRRSALEGEAPYCERSFMYAEDLDLCWRLHQRGTPTVLAADVSIVHVGNVAGAQAWGSSRSPVFWAATYDVVAERIGRGRARVLALSAALAAAVAIVRIGVTTALGRRRNRGPEARVRASELRAHLRAALVGPAPAVDPPGRS